MTEDEYRARIEQSFQLNELTKHPGWPILVDYMESVVMKPIKLRLLNGNMPSLEEYKRWTGFCEGATRVLDAHEVIAKMVLDEQGRLEEVRIEELEFNRV